MKSDPLRVVHISSYNSVGGAARAARALHEAMIDDGIDSILVVGQSDGQGRNVQAPHPKRFVLAGELDRKLWRLTKSPRLTWRSPAVFGSLNAATVNAFRADVINLHWITNGLLSIRQIGDLRSPTVWSMYDMWPFSGTEHYHSDPDRYRHSYESDTRSPDEAGLDIDRWTWQRKQRHWQTPMTMVPASGWLESAVRSSSLMQSWPVRRIPHLIDVEAHHPSDRQHARQQLELPPSKRLITFLATAGITDERKGWTHLRDAVAIARLQDPDIEVVVVGPRGSDQQPFPVHWLGEIHNEKTLNLAYAAADIIATPSIQDTMPLSAMEAQSCGRAVIGFDVGGLPDIVKHGVSGYLAPAFDGQALGSCLTLALDQAEELGAAARARAISLWSPAAVVGAYRELYAELIPTPRS